MFVEETNGVVCDFVHFDSKYHYILYLKQIIKQFFFLGGVSYEDLLAAAILSHPNTTIIGNENDTIWQHALEQKSKRF